jgi:hypothetical protein
MMAYGAVEVRIHVFVTTSLDVGEWPRTPSAFTTGERAPGSDRLGGWLSPSLGSSRKWNPNLSVMLAAP